MTFLLYLGKVMLCSGILLGYYWLFLRNKRFHHYNRFYLQATLLLSVILPFIRIPVWNNTESAVNQVVYETLQVLTVTYGEGEELSTGPGLMEKLFTLNNALFLFYGLGIMVLLWSLFRSLLYIRKISRQYPYERIGGLKFFSTTEPNTPFSFFRSIFWNNELPFNSHDGQQIFRHELFHVQQKHSSDIILTEVITAFFWFNPFFHLLKKELKAIHEFLADQYAISGNDRYAYAELLVLQTLKAKQVSITNHFFQNHIKRRIAMITNNQSRRYSYRSRLMALPVLALAFCTIALYAQQTSHPVAPAGSDNKPITVVIDAGHGGIDGGAFSPDGKVKEKDIALQISQKIQQLAPTYNVNVVMTRTDDNLPGGTTEIGAGLKARTALAEKQKAEMYISIHISTTGAEKETSVSGFEIYISNKDNDRTTISKQLGAAFVQELSKLYTTNPALLQKSKNIWVLEQTPCPAVLIECGYINNEKDLSFFSNSSNQEATAKRILEAIVNYKNKPAAVIETIVPAQKVAQAKPAGNPTPAAKPAATPASAVNTTPATAPVPVAVPVPAATPAKATPIAIAYDPKDPIVPRLAAHFCRHVRYPKKALANQVEGKIYFSASVSNNGEVSNIKVYDEAPVEADQINKMTTVGMVAPAYKSTTDPLTTVGMKQAMEEEVRKAFEKQPNLEGLTPQSETYYFEVVFRLNKILPVAKAAPVKPVTVALPAKATADAVPVKVTATPVIDRQMLLPNISFWKKTSRC